MFDARTAERIQGSFSISWTGHLGGPEAVHSSASSFFLPQFNA